MSDLTTIREAIGQMKTYPLQPPDWRTELQERALEALDRIEEALKHKCCGCPHRKGLA